MSTQADTKGPDQPAIGENQMPGTSETETPRRLPGDDTEYDVRWVIDITAPDPVEAAREALRTQRDPSSWATVFIVTELREDGAQWRVDLDDPEDNTEVLRTRETARPIAGTGLDTATGPGDPDAPACLQALHAALAEARQALAGDSKDTEHDALNGLTETVAAFLGEKAPGQRADLAATQPEAGLRSIETGTSRSLAGVGRDVCAAVRKASDSDIVTSLNVDGRQAAAIVPVDSHGNPACMRTDHMQALLRSGGLPAILTSTEAATYVFSTPVSVTCNFCGDRVAAGAEDLAQAWDAAREHKYRHQREV